MILVKRNSHDVEHRLRLRLGALSTAFAFPFCCLLGGLGTARAEGSGCFFSLPLPFMVFWIGCGIASDDATVSMWAKKQKVLNTKQHFLFNGEGVGWSNMLRGKGIQSLCLLLQYLLCGRFCCSCCSC
jgi:hypothetical protein